MTSIQKKIYRGLEKILDIKIQKYHFHLSKILLLHPQFEDNKTRPFAPCMFSWASKQSSIKNLPDHNLGELTQKLEKVSSNETDMVLLTAMQKA